MEEQKGNQQPEGSAPGKASGEGDCYLLPCPFCGGMHCGVFKEDEFGPWQAGCHDCDVPGPASDTMEGACELWNNRGPREFTKEDIVNLFTCVEYQVDAQLKDIDKREYLKRLSDKVRLWIGAKR